jgi:hypothetical protein
LEEFRFEIPEPFPVRRPACRIPEIPREVKVPTEVMLGWAGWVTTRAVLALATFPTKLLELRFEIPEPFPVNKLEFKIPETTREVKVPSDVTLG